MRGLKSFGFVESQISVPVAPLVGAWIEINSFASSIRKCNWSHPSWVRGLKCIGIITHLKVNLCRTPRGCVDWNLNLIYISLAQCSRTPRGCVDWNLLHITYYNNLQNVAPLVGAWIEIRYICCLSTSFYVAPLVGAWIEIIEDCRTKGQNPLSHPSWVRGLKLNSVAPVFLHLWSHPSWVRGLK